jgi:hypothetical protein
MDREQAHRDLAPAYWRAQRALAPAEPENITEALRVLAETLCVHLPEDDGLMVYVSLLQALPYRALRYGFLEILKTYSYPRLPHPAELLAACSPAAHELMFWEQSLKRALTLIEKAP